MNMSTAFALSVALAAATLGIAGCGQAPSQPPPAAQTPEHAHDDGHEEHADAGNPKGHDHSGWWCAEHGVPEEVCSMCSAKVAGEFQKQGDWCAEHDRAKSQCFICDPSLKEKFAAQYRAKYGKEPPPLEEEGHEEHSEKEQKSS